MKMNFLKPTTVRKKGDRELKLAYDVLDIIEERYACDFEYLKEFTDRLCAYYSTLETVK